MAFLKKDAESKQYIKLRITEFQYPKYIPHCFKNGYNLFMYTKIIRNNNATTY